VVAWDSAIQDGGTAGVYAQRYSAAGAPLGGEFKVNTTLVGHQQIADIGALSGGGFVVAWRTPAQDGDLFGVFAQAYDASGTPQGTEFQVNSFTTGDQTNPAIAALPSNGFVIVWSSDDQDGSSSGIYAQRFATSTGISDIALSDYAYLEDEINQTVVATLSTLGSESSLITYELLSDSSGTGFRIEGNRLIVNNNQALDFETAPIVTLRILATDENGQSFGEDIDVTILDTNPEVRLTASDEFRVNTETNGDQFGPVIARLSNGGMVVVWNSEGQDGDSHGIYAQLYDANGLKLGGEFLVNTTTANAQNAPTVSALSGGGFVVGWASVAQDGYDYGVYAQRFSNAGAKLGGEFRANTETANAQFGVSSAGTGDGGFVLVWHSFGQDAGGDSGIYSQRYNASGAVQGGETLVNTATTGGQLGPAVAGLAGGGYVVVWNGPDAAGNGLFGQVFNASGAKVGGEFTVNAFDAGEQRSVDVVGLAGGGFVAVWTSDFLDGDTTGIVGQRFDATGAKVGPEFIVNATTTDQQDTPEIAALDNGGFAVTWASVGNDGSTWGVFLQRFDASGNPLGPELLINKQVIGAQLLPAVAPFGVDGFMVAWESEGQDGSGSGVYARSYQYLSSQPPTAVGESYTVAEDGTLSVTSALGVLANDHDPENNPLTAQLVTGPAHGTLTLNANGSFTYKPAANYSGPDSFTYNAYDGTTGTPALVTLTVTPDNDWPVANPDSVSTNANTFFEIPDHVLLANDVDIDGGVLRVDEVFNATHGTVTLLVGSVVLFTPEPGFAGTGGFDYTMNDDRGGTSTAHVTVNIKATQVANRAPVIDPDSADVATLRDTAIGFVLKANDPDGDPLTYSSGAAAHGSVTGGTGGAFTYTPAAGFVGTDSFTVTASDGRGGNDLQVVSIAVLPPLASGNGDWRMFADSGFTGEVGETGNVFGTAGFQDIRVLDLPGVITFDPSFNQGGDIVRLGGVAAQWHVLLSGSRAVFSDGDTFVSLPIGETATAVVFDDGARSLLFAGVARLGAQALGGSFQPVAAPPDGVTLPTGASAAASARLFLDEDASASVGGKLVVYGTAGEENLHLTRGTVTLDPSFNLGGDTVFLGGAAGTYTARLIGSSVLLDGTLVDVTIPVGSNGMSLAFNDASHVLALNTQAGTVSIGDQLITSAATPLTFA